MHTDKSSVRGKDCPVKADLADLTLILDSTDQAHAKSFTDLVYPVYQSEKNFQLVQVRIYKNLPLVILIRLMLIVRSPLLHRSTYKRTF